MDTAPVAVLLSDKAGKLVYANREAERIWVSHSKRSFREGQVRYRLLDADGTPTPARPDGAGPCPGRRSPPRPG